MTDLYYTEAHEDLDSELVYDVWYDDKTQEAHVNLHDIVYTYSNVPAEAVKTLVGADSVGREFNGSFLTKGFKHKFGPGKKHGYYDDDVVLNKRELAVAAPAGTHYYSPGNTTTTGYPGVVPKNLTVNPNASATGKTVPLRTPLAETNAALEAQKQKGTYTVHFESDYSGSKTYTVEATSVDAAVAELNDVTSRLGLRVKVTGVFVHLG